MLVTQTPTRISFFGGGTDFREFFSASGGAVLSTAIDKYLYVIVKERFNADIALSWRKREITRSVDEIQHELVRETLKYTDVRSGIEIVTTADIPSEGSGLGSSSALTVGLLNAFWQYKGEMKSAAELLHEAWGLKRRLAKGISDPDLDSLYDAARGAGALGGKILGAGGGGFLMVYCPLGKQEALCARMLEMGHPEMRFRFERDGTKAIFNIRRDTWKTFPRPPQARPDRS